MVQIQDSETQVDYAHLPLVTVLALGTNLRIPKI